jgi:hypothetical protein
MYPGLRQVRAFWFNDIRDVAFPTIVTDSGILG